MFNQTAPIILFVYNRPDHTQQTLAALSENEFASESRLYVYCDGPKVDCDSQNQKQIEATRAVVRSKNWCKEVFIIEREKNFGLSNSIIAGVSDVLLKEGAVIVLEDDIVTGKGFLKYMNEALEFYKHRDEVISIHGYNYPICSKGLKDTFFLKGADCWGWATWSRGWKYFNDNAAELYRKIIDQNLSYDFDLQGAYPFTKMLQHQIDGRVNSWAIRWYASAFLANKFTLYPTKSLVKNIGLDGSGTHGQSAQLSTSTYADYCHILNIPIEHNFEVTQRIKQLFKQQNRKPLYQGLKFFCKKVLTKLSQ